MPYADKRDKRLFGLAVTEDANTLATLAFIELLGLQGFLRFIYYKLYIDSFIHMQIYSFTSLASDFH